MTVPRLAALTPLVLATALALVLSLVPTHDAEAQTGTPQAPAKAIADTPATAPADHTTPVAVVHSGVDRQGTALAFKLKEIFNTSSLFKLSGDDEPKIRLVLTTRDEFPGRPAMGSAYSAVWTYLGSQDDLSHYLDSQVGLVDGSAIAATAEALAAATDAVSARYAYLLTQ